MNFNASLRVFLAATLLFLPNESFARGRGGGGGGGGFHGGGGVGGGARPGFSGGGGSGGGSRPNLGNASNHSPSFSHPTGGGSSHPNFSGGNRPSTLPAGTNRPNFGGGGGGATTLPGGANRPNISNGNRPNFGGGNAATTLPGVANRPNFSSGNRPSTLPGVGNRPNLGGNNNIIAGNKAGNIGNNNIGRISNNNIGHIGNNNFNNIHNNINIASNRPYYNNWQHGNWNGNWNRPGGSGYWNGWAHGYSHGYWNGGWGGYWHGGWGGYWGLPWYASPITWGLGAWAVGSVMYNSGYAMYSNPYYVNGGNTSAYYDYSQPITVINQQPDANSLAGDQSTSSVVESSPAPEVQEGTSHMDLARAAFKNGDYPGASREIDLAIQQLPNDAVLHEFRALILFAMQDYKQAAATLYAVLSAGPGWDWTTMSGMYAGVSTYTDQLRQLEEFVKANQSAADAHFVLAYHYLTCGYTEEARKQYEDVVKLQPENQLAAQLVTLVGGGSAAEAANQPTPQSPGVDSTEANQATPPTAIDATKIVGMWKASRKDGASFKLDLTSDSKFTWGFEQGGRKQEFGGKYSVDGAVLVLERTDGAQMPGIVTLASNGFNFKLYGGPPDDSGLDFSK